jgi:RHS repeat-associated protein
MVVLSTDVAIETRGFNFPFSTLLQYNNFANGVSVGFGKNWAQSSGLGGLTIDGGIVQYHEGPNAVKVFLRTIGGNFDATYFVLDRLFYNSGTDLYTLTSPRGVVKVFNGSGKLISFQNPGGETGNVTYSGGLLDTVQMTDGTESWLFDYNWTGVLVQEVIFSVNSNPVRKAVYAYDGGGQLLTIKIYAYIGGSWGTQTVSASRYSYHSATGLLRHVITPTGYQQMLNNGINPDSATEAQLNDYAETEYEYDGDNRVLTMRTHGRAYIIVFAYTPQSQASPSLNVWTAKTAITQADNSLLTYYFNLAGQVILKQVSDHATAPTKVWNEYAQQFQEMTGRLLVKADAAAISAVNEAMPALVALSTNSGRVEVTEYTGNGYVNYTGVREGTGGTLNKLKQIAYTSRPVSGLGTIYLPSTETVYRGDGSTDGVVTGYTYDWHGSTFQISQRVTTLPTVSTGENGTGTAVTVTEYYDQGGYRTSSVDGRGTVTKFEYDKVKGSLKQKIEDYGSGKLNLTTDYQSDDLGRTTLELGPAHDIDLSGISTNLRRARWTYYKDREGERWSFGGYRKTTGSVDQIVGPVTILRPNLAPPSGYAGYRQASKMDAVYSSAGIPPETTVFAQNTWVRWTLSLFSKADKLTEEWKYFIIPATDYGTQSVNYGKKLFAYDGVGRLNQTTCAGGTIDKTTFNAMGWAVQEQLGTSAGLTVTEINEYYDNGTLKKVTQPVDSTSAHDRVTEKTYDFRQRLKEDRTTVEKDGGGTWLLISAFGYDNRDLRTSATGYHTSVSNANRTGYQTQVYDALGRPYRTLTYAVAVDGSGNLVNALTDNRYYDEAGQIARNAPSGSTLTTATQYDAVGRQVALYQATGTFSTTAPADVTSAIVMEQSAYAWDDGGNLISTTAKQRFDNAVGNGPLDSATVEPKARISYGGIYPDALGREQARANYGTNGGSAWSRPATIPSRSNTVLVTGTAYTAAGNVGMVTGPAGIITESVWDKADRLISRVENQPGSSSSSSSSSSGYATDVRTTHYEYTDDGWLKMLKSDNAATGQQVTEWVYGVTPGQGSELYSNRLVHQKKYPDYSGGSDLVRYLYNRQQQVIELRDQAGTEHGYTYDKLGRLLADAAGNFGSGIDDTVNKLEYAYNQRGLRTRATSYLTADDSEANEVRWDYNDFNQPVTEYQEHGGAVDPATSRKVLYAYADGSANTIRRESLTMASGTVQNYHYSTGLPNDLSRPDAVRESSTDIATYRYLGLGSSVGVDYPVPAVALTYQHGSSGDAGDQYTGLDRFGRVTDLRWNKSGTALVSSQYGYDRNSNQTWRKDVAAAAAAVNTEDQMFWYDGLQQVYQRQRGTLTPSTPPYTGITSLQQTEVFSFDETGNWLSDYNSTGGPLTQSRTHNAANEIASITGPTSVVQPVYGAVGNTTTVPQPGNWTAGHTLKWDAWNRLVEVSTAATAYRYDALFRRIYINVGGAEHDYYYTDQWQVSEVFNGSTLSWRAFWGLRNLNDIIKRDGVSGLGTSLYGLRDKLNFVAVTDSSGSVNLRIAYNTFGEARYLTSAWAAGSNTYYWNCLFHGYEWDAQSGFLAVRYRTYHPTLGRWLSRDPIGEKGGLNLYAMVLNNPISNNDMLGLDLGGDGTPYGYDPTQPGPHNGYEPDPTYPPGKGPADYEPAPMPPPLKQAECCKDGKKTMYQPDIQCCRDGEVISQIPRWQDEGGTLIDCINRLVQTEDGGNGAGITTAEAIGAGVGGAIGGKAAGGKGAAAGGVAGWEAGANAYRAAMRNLCLMLQCPSKK